MARLGSCLGWLLLRRLSLDAVRLSVLSGISCSNMSGADGTCHLAGCFGCFKLLELVEKILVSEFFAEEFNLPLAQRHLLFMILDNGLPVDLLLEITEHLGSLFESLCDVDILLSTFDALDGLLELDLRTADFEAFSLDELLFLEMHDGCLLLASL